MCASCGPSQPAARASRPGGAAARAYTTSALLVLSLLVAMLPARGGWAPGDQSVLFAVPMLVAAHRYRPRFVAILALLCICLDRGRDWRLHGVGHPWSLTEVLLVCIGLLAVALSSQRQQTAARAQEAEDAIRRLQYQAWHDALTGLPNRAYFLEQLRAALERSRAVDGEPFALLFIDCDGFKRINDAYGHAVGDLLLRDLGERLQRCLGEHDLAARLGGDEFAILLSPLPDTSRAALVAAQAARRIAEPFAIGGAAVTITASIGTALSSAGYDRPEAVLHDADLGMYEAKRLARQHARWR